MRAFTEAYPDEQIVQQLVALIPWFHNCVKLPTIEQLEAELENLSVEVEDEE